MNGISEKISSYFNKTTTYGNLRFIFELASVAFFYKFIAIVIAITIFSLLGLPTDSNNQTELEMLSYGWLWAIPLVILYASFETLLGQWFFIYITSLFTKKIWIQILISSALFALLHIEPILIAAVFPIGIFLSWSFIIKRRISRWEAFWVTTTIHVVHNLFVLWLVWISL